MTHHLAQINIGRMAAPLDHPQMAGFMNNLDEINQLAEATPGFVWRLQTGEGNATALRPYGDPEIIINMSVWENLKALRRYTYFSLHADFLRQRKQWFAPHEGPYLAMWWIPAGHIPTTDEGKARLDHLTQHGPTPHAFTFRQPFTLEDLLADGETPPAP